MRFLIRIIKSLLRFVFSVIIFLLLVGLAKMNRQVNTYISFLNGNDRSAFHWSQPATWADPFWSTNQTSGGIADVLSEEDIPSELSGLDVYDPAFEDELNEFTDGSFSGTEDTGYGFVTDGQSPETTSSGTISKSDLLNLIKQRELAK